jgi:hypothetical protein
MFTCSYPVPRAHVPWTIHIAKVVPSSIPKGYLGSMHKPKRARNWLAVSSSVCDISLVPADNTRNTVRFLVGPAILAMSAGPCAAVKTERDVSDPGSCQCRVERDMALVDASRFTGSQLQLWGGHLSGPCFTGGYKQRKKPECCCWVCLSRLWAVLLRKAVFMSQYRPLKDDKGQAAASSVATRAR